jgi:hypothetical protein
MKPIDALAARVRHRLQQRPDLIVDHDAWGNPIIRLPLPPDWRPQSNPNADRLEARLNHRTLEPFELAEVCDRVSGGWMHNCIPPRRLIDFLRGWLAATEPREEQLEMPL